MAVRMRRWHLSRTRPTRVERPRERPFFFDLVVAKVSILIRLLVEVDDAAQLQAVVKALQGQLTATLHAEADDGPLAASLLPLLCEKAGRVLFNGYPTGVEVCDAMVHGGPWPATTDARGTSVGSRAIERFLRPVCLQNAPAALLPPALQDANPLNLLRLVNGQWTREAISSSH